MRKFLADESGAVVADYIVLGAAIVGTGLSASTSVHQGVTAIGDSLRDTLRGVHVAGNPVARFDFNDVTGLTRTGWGWVAIGSYQGWTAIGPTRAIEVVESGHRGIHTPDGGNWIDLDASPGLLVLGRELDQLTSGRSYNLRFNAAHSHYTQGDSVEVYFGGQLVDVVTPTSNQFSNFSMQFVAGSGDGSNQIEFRGTGAGEGFGVSLHGVEIY